MMKYDKNSLFDEIERRKNSLSSLSDEDLEKEVSHTRKLLESSLPTCLRRRTETIVSSKSASDVEKEMERFSYEAYWLKLLFDYAKQAKKEVEKRKAA